MSYRRAWLLVDELNQLFAAPLVAAHHGGAKGGGAALTEEGRRIVALYREAEAKMRAAAEPRSTPSRPRSPRPTGRCRRRRRFRSMKTRPQPLTAPAL